MTRRYRGYKTFQPVLENKPTKNPLALKETNMSEFRSGDDNAHYYYYQVEYFGEIFNEWVYKLE